MSKDFKEDIDFSAYDEVGDNSKTMVTDRATFYVKDDEYSNSLVWDGLYSVTSNTIGISTGEPTEIWAPIGKTGLALHSIKKGTQYKLSSLSGESQRVLVKNVENFTATVVFLTDKGDQISDPVAVDLSNFVVEDVEEVDIIPKKDETRNRIYVQGFHD